MEGTATLGNGVPDVGDEIAGKYLIEGVLGQGGMGTVFAARNVLTGKRVAIKWLLPEQANAASRERLLREARIASSIEHPNVVDIYDVGEHQGGLFLVMEYLRGRSLADVLAEHGRLDPEEVVTLLAPALRGVHAAHLAGVVHRDLKAENIILSELDGQIVPKVLDFGVSKTTGANIPNSSLTRTGALVGTPHYMALEQVDGSNQVDARTDVYAFGVLIYRALTGHFPFDGSSLGEVILKIGTKDPVPLRMLRPELPAELESVVLRALSRDRRRRFADAEEFVRALSPFAPSVRLRDSVDTTGRFTVGSAGELLGSRAAYIASAPGSAQLPSASSVIGASPMLGAAVSQQGAGVRATPVTPAARSRGKYWAALAGSAALLFGGGAWYAHRTSLLAESSPQTQAVPVAGAAASKGPLGTAPAGAERPQAVVEQLVAAPPVGGDEPALDMRLDLDDSKAADEGPPVQDARAAALAPEDPASKRAAAASAEHVRRARAAQAANRARAQAAGRAQAASRAQAPKVIPGDRTKGFTIDDF